MADDTDKGGAPSDMLLGQFGKSRDWSGLDHVGQKVARSLRTLFEKRGVETPKVRYHSYEEIAFGDWSAERKATDVMARMRMAPMKGSVAICLPGSLVAQLVDLHYGGDGSGVEAQAELSGAAQRYVERLLGQLADTISAEWAEIHKVELSFLSFEAAPSRLRVARSDETMLLQQWEIGAGNLTDAKISMAIACESIRKLAPMLGGFGPQESENIDEGWRQELRQAAMDVQLPVRTIFARPNIDFSKLMTLKAGDIIPITLPKKVPVSVSGMLFAYGSVGESDGRSAIRIESIEKRYADYE